MKELPPPEFFERNIVRIDRLDDDSWLVKFHCGHHGRWMMWPPHSRLTCTECVNEHVRAHKKEQAAR